MFIKIGEMQKYVGEALPGNFVYCTCIFIQTLHKYEGKGAMPVRGAKVYMSLVECMQTVRLRQL